MADDAIVRTSLIDSFLFTTNALYDRARGVVPRHRQDVLREAWDDIVVDTCCPGDTARWETGVSRDSEQERWTIVAQYPNRDAAVAGHDAWVARLRADPQQPLTDIDLYQ